MGSSISSKKQTSEFAFTTMIPQVDLFSFIFWRKSMTPKNHFEINWPLTAAQVSCTQSSPSPASVLGEYQTYSLSFTIFLCSIVLTNCCYFSRDRLLSTVELQVSTRAERILLHLEHVLQISKISKIPFTSTRRTRAKISEIFGWDFRRNDDLINSFWI